MSEEKKGIGAAIGSAVGMIVLACACAVGGWIACDMWPKGGPKGPAGFVMPPATVAVRPVELRPYNLPERFVAHACLALWSGLVHARIAGFMSEGLVETLGEAFACVWKSIRIAEPTSA